MTTRTQDEIRADIARSEQEATDAHKRKQDFTTELGHAKIRDATPHPWLGLCVIKRPPFPRSKSLRGVLCRNEHPNRLHVAGNAFDPAELFVRSHSGKSSYHFTQPGNRETGKGWELEK